MHKLFLDDDEYDLRDLGKQFAMLIDRKAPDDVLVKFNCVCPVDELSPIECLPIYNQYVEDAQHSGYLYGIQLKIGDPATW